MIKPEEQDKDIKQTKIDINAPLFPRRLRNNPLGLNDKDSDRKRFLALSTMEPCETIFTTSVLRLKVQFVKFLDGYSGKC